MASHEVIMSTYDRLVHRRRNAVRLEAVFLATICIIAAAMMQIAF